MFYFIPEARKTYSFVLPSLLIFSLFGHMPANDDWISLSNSENAPNIAEIHILEDPREDQSLYASRAGPQQDKSVQEVGILDVDVLHLDDDCVEPVEDAWKVTNLELLEEKRIDPHGRTSS